MSLIATGVTSGESTGKLIVLNLSGYRKARIWLGEVPELNYPVVEVLSRTKEAQKFDISEVRRTAVEMLIPTGGCFIYGLLEAELLILGTIATDIFSIKINGRSLLNTNFSF